MRLFVPGRLCLFGEHSDWAADYREVNPRIEEGHALIVGTDQGIEATVGRHPDSLELDSAVPGLEDRRRTIHMDPEQLAREARSGGFWSYVAGVASVMARRYPVGGLFLTNDRMDLPVRKGLSSSAAICVLSVRAFNRLYDLGLSLREEMELAYLGETATSSRCGRMDQGCAFGRGPIHMTFDSGRLDVRELSAGGDFHLLLVDLNAAKDTRAILTNLHRAFPFPSGEVERGVHELLGPINRAIVMEAVNALQSGQAERLGALMSRAQRAFDQLAAPASPVELASPVLHRLLAWPGLWPHIWGGKGVGSQGDGSAQLVARSESDREAAIGILERELGMRTLPLTIRRGEAAH